MHAITFDFYGAYASGAASLSGFKSRPDRNTGKPLAAAEVHELTFDCHEEGGLPNVVGNHPTHDRALLYAEIHCPFKNMEFGIESSNANQMQSFLPVTTEWSHATTGCQIHPVWLR